MTGEPLIETVAELGSTNAEMVARSKRTEPPREGTWLVADRQTAGKGRLGRDWQDGAGNFMGSTLVHLRPGDPPPQTLALVAALAAYDATAPLLSEPHRLMLKWPNDLLLDGAKLAGILLESTGRSVIIGIGVNLISAPNLPDRRTACLSDTGARVSRDDFASMLAAQMRDALTLWRDAGIEQVVARWETHGPATDARVRAEVPGQGAVDGIYSGLNREGAMLLRLEDGTMRVIHAGEVSLLGSEQGD